jgi:polyisoprenoid-binding protein YceI
VARRLLVSAVLAFSLAADLFGRRAEARTIDYVIDQESADIRFHTEVAKVVPVDGAFTRFQGHILLDTEHPAAISIDVLVDDDAMVVPFGGAPTLRSAAYFDHARFPTIRFHSDDVTVTAANRFTVTGLLTIRGVTHREILTGEMTQLTLRGVPAIRVSAVSTLDRTSYGMVADRPLIADRVDLHITATLRAP